MQLCPSIKSDPLNIAIIELKYTWIANNWKGNTILCKQIEYWISSRNGCRQVGKPVFHSRINWCESTFLCINWIVTVDSPRDKRKILFTLTLFWQLENWLNTDSSPVRCIDDTYLHAKIKQTLCWSTLEKFLTYFPAFVSQSSVNPEENQTI